MVKSRLPKNFWIWMLLFAGVVISAPRFAGSFATAIGRDVFEIVPVLLPIEIFAGFALAIFEALGYAFISHRWQQINLFDTTLPPDTSIRDRIIVQNAIYWVVLALGQLVLLISIPIVAVGHLATQMWAPEPLYNLLTWRHIGQHHLTWIWLFIVAGVQTLFVFLIGLSIERYLIRFDEEKDQIDEMSEPIILYKQPKEMSDDELKTTISEIQDRNLGEFVGGNTPPPPYSDSTKVTLRKRDV